MIENFIIPLLKIIASIGIFLIVLILVSAAIAFTVVVVKTLYEELCGK